MLRKQLARDTTSGIICTISAKTGMVEAIRTNPLGVRFADACKAAEWLGFVQGGSGSHRAFARAGEPALLNFQNRGGNIPPYQARQLAALIDKYGDLA